MSEKKQCPKCKGLQPLKRYTQGRIQCNVCLEQKQRYREKHREELRDKAKAYYEQNREQKHEYQKQYRTQMDECSVCHVSIQRGKMTRHEQSKTHLHNLNHPDNHKLTYRQQHEQKQKQKQEKEQQEKEQHRKEHKQTIAYLNETFPSYPSET